MGGLALGWLRDRGLSSFGGGSAVWTLAHHFRVLVVSVRISKFGVSGSSLAFSNMWTWSVGVLRPGCAMAACWVSGQNPPDINPRTKTPWTKTPRQSILFRNFITFVFRMSYGKEISI